MPAEEQPYEVPENWVWVRLGEVNKYVSKSVNPISEPDKILSCTVFLVWLMIILKLSQAQI